MVNSCPRRQITVKLSGGHRDPPLQVHRLEKIFISHYSFICGETIRRTLQPYRWLHLISRDGVGTVPYNTAVGIYKLCGRFVNRPYALHIIIWFSFSILIIHYSFFIGKKGTSPFYQTPTGLPPPQQILNVC